MTRWAMENWKKNYLKAKLQNFWKGSDTPYFEISKWNWQENEVVGKWEFIEWKLTKISLKDTNYWKYCLINLLDDEWNDTQWGMKLWTTMKWIIYKLFAPAMKDIKIDKVIFKTGVFMTERWDKKYVSLFIDGQKWDNPFSTWDGEKYVVSKDITDKILEIKHPTTWEVVSKDDSKLVEWIENLLIPTINADLKTDTDKFYEMWTEVPVKKEEKKDEDYSDLPFN